MKIVHMTSAHSRYDSRIFLKECNTLAKNKYEVCLIVADGLKSEIKDNIKIYNIGAKVSNRVFRSLISSFLIYKKARNINADIFHFHDPELIPFGLLLSIEGRNVVYDIHEDLAQQILIKAWIPSSLRKPISLLFSKFEVYACKMFYSLVVPQDEMKTYFSKYNKHTYTLYNFPNGRDNKVSFQRKNPFQLIYAGSISEERGIFNMLSLISELHRLDNRYKLVLAGNIPIPLLNKTKEHDGWQYVDYKGLLSTDELYQLYSESTIGLIMFNNIGQYYMSYALKLFEYMQNGLTVVMPNFGNWLDFNKKFNVGYCVDVKDPFSSAQLINNLCNVDLELYCHKNQETCSTSFIWESQTDILLKVYHH